MCQKQSQHRDLSIGNILMVDEAIECKPFDIPNPDKVQTGILKVCRELKVDTACNGFVIDGDMAVDWRHYFTKEDTATKSVGTTEFMSDDLLINDQDYIHSPLDDYRSLYYVAQWACVFHELSPEESPKNPNVFKPYAQTWLELTEMQ
ncbi:hypothetical protein BDP27DRAFT_525929 [Rhodocollybia butyracea]|uniref:Fungal-type protein kinase domain-containing protein n=1 Tax=Rhodocollybia butyracea TaxID=206335 RepID=A0A9P5PZH2_9AGAR|nr:hypothetical protein BDP27DRAFT_525929 [Rhodocollybia butyracea]